MRLRFDRRRRLLLSQLFVGSVATVLLYCLVYQFTQKQSKGKFLTHYRDFDGNILPGTFEGEIGAGIRFDNQPIHLVVVACGGKLKSAFEEAVTMVKSAVLFSKNHLLIHIFTSDLKEDFRNEFFKWPGKYKAKFEVIFHKAEYPLPEKETEEIKNWWAPCASLRLFLPEILKEVDSVLYVDCDVIFLSPVDALYSHLYQFRSPQVGALAPRVGWTFTKIPDSNEHYIMKKDGVKTQINSGVFLMNLTRLREERFSTHPEISKKKFSWSKELIFPLYYKFKNDMYGDQDLINIIFHFNPDHIFYLSCQFNYHHKFCIDEDLERQCADAELGGAAVVHGSAKTFHNNYAPAFRAIYDAMQKYNFQADVRHHLLDPMVKSLNTKGVVNDVHCGGQKTGLFINYLLSSISEL